MRSIFIMIAAAFVLLVVFLGLISSTVQSGKKQAGDPDKGGQPQGPVRIFGNNGKTTIEQVPDPGDIYDDKEIPVSKPRPWVEDDRWFEDVVDHDEILEERAFYYLVHKAAVATDEDIDQAADTGINSMDLLLKPSSFRGKAVMVQGDLLSLASTEFPDNRSGIRTAFHGTIVDNKYKPISFYVFSFPSDVQQRDVLEIRGYFYKIWKYKNVKNVEVSSPLIIGRVVKKIPKYVKAEPIRFFGLPLTIGNRNVVWGEIIVVVLFLVMIPTFFLLYLSEVKKYEKYRIEQVEKRKLKTATAKNPAKEDAAAAPGTPPPPVASDAGSGCAGQAPVSGDNPGQTPAMPPTQVPATPGETGEPQKPHEA